MTKSDIAGKALCVAFAVILVFLAAVALIFCIADLTNAQNTYMVTLPDSSTKLVVYHKCEFNMRGDGFVICYNNSFWTFPAPYVIFEAIGLEVIEKE